MSKLKKTIKGLYNLGKDIVESAPYDYEKLQTWKGDDDRFTHTSSFGREEKLPLDKKLKLHREFKKNQNKYDEDSASFTTKNSDGVPVHNIVTRKRKGSLKK